MPDFRPAKREVFEARTLYFLAAWIENAGLAKDFPLHLACIGRPPSTVRHLGDRCNASITVHEPLSIEGRGVA
ncbi:hypothetical protein MJD09_04500, partial [bacterium]|nr:hypothetical protein [bacterium]